MSTIEIYEPALCCATGVCGPELDQSLVSFGADLDWVREQGGSIARFNLASEPTAFAGNTTVSQFLQLSGSAGLPMVLVDGVTALTGTYPDREQLARWAGVASAPTSRLDLVQAESTAGCCGGDVPNGGC